MIYGFDCSYSIVSRRLVCLFVTSLVARKPYCFTTCKHTPREVVCLYSGIIARPRGLVASEVTWGYAMSRDKYKSMFYCQHTHAVYDCECERRFYSQWLITNPASLPSFSVLCYAIGKSAIFLIVKPICLYYSFILQIYNVYVIFLLCFWLLCKSI